MSETQRITDLMRRAYSGGAWHGPSVSEVLSDIDWQLGSRKTAGQSHSIWEILLHITAWKKTVAGRLAGKTQDIRLDSDQEWPRIPEPTDSAWREALQRLEDAQRHLMAILEKLSDANLENTYQGQEGVYTFYQLAHGIIQHDLYHAGQIAVLKK